MTRTLVLAAALFVAQVATGAELVVYTYDSFVSWGPAQAIERVFEAAHPGVDLVWVAPGDSSEMLARLIAEQQAGGTEADVFLGIADVELPRALARGALQTYDARLVPNLADVPADLMFDDTGHAIPFDHGYVTFVYDAQALPRELVPRTLEDLTRPELRGKIILEDPRTSSPGLSFLLWTVAHFGEEGWADFWRALLPNVLTVTKGWSEAYQMFEAGEAPIVLSYSTDTAYSYLASGSVRYQVVTPGGEAFRQVEGMALVAGTDQPALAHAFLNLVLSKDIQERIPTSQWMFPASAAAELPEAFREHAVVPDRAVSLPPDYVAEHLESWLNRWQQVLVGG
ncbi:MAG: thiamine ABC transporter substrate-binding protein [Candidatus Bipolaricaulaceae bacterium]